MRLGGLGSQIASSLAALAIAVVSVPASAGNALAAGGPSGGFVITPGTVASFTAVTFSACNSLTWGYQLSGGSNQGVFTFPGGCRSGTGPNLTIGPFAAPTTFRVFLSDNHCNVTYYSDGTPIDHVVVSGSNPYSLRFADAGGFCEKTNTTDNTFSGCNFCVDLSITDSAVAASGRAISSVEGGGVSGTVATFTDPDPAGAATDYKANISWGDGSTSAGVVSGTGTFAIAASHTYGEEGAYAVSVTIADVDDPSNTSTVTTTATVGDAALTAAPACLASVLGAYNGSTATFADAAGSLATASDFTATIDWGDTTSSAGTIAPSGGGFAVTGSHHYASLGQFTIKTAIRDDGGSVASTSCTTIGFAFAPGGGAFAVGVGHAATGQAVTFWSSRWTALNLSGAPRAARSFKGFADAPASPTCGSVWSGDPGNSAPPPAGPLPQYMGVIVTSSANQSGADISGTVVHIVVVRTNPGYSPAPGHAGTGTVVAVVC